MDTQITMFPFPRIGSWGIAEVGTISCSALPPSTAAHIPAGRRGEGHCARSTTPAGHGFPWEFSHQLLTQPCLACGIRQAHSMKLCGCSVRQRDPELCSAMCSWRKTGITYISLFGDINQMWTWIFSYEDQSLYLLLLSMLPSLWPYKA